LTGSGNSEWGSCGRPSEPRNRRIPTTDRTPTGQFNVGGDPGNFHDILKTLYVGSVNFTTYVCMSMWSRVSTLESELSRGRRHSVEDWTIDDAKKIKTEIRETLALKFSSERSTGSAPRKRGCLKAESTFRTTRLAHSNRVYLWTRMSFCPTWGVFTQRNLVIIIIIL